MLGCQTQMQVLLSIRPLQKWRLGVLYIHLLLVLSDGVADRCQVREILRIPVPHVYSWSEDPSNPARAEYIIEAKAEGHSLGSLWGGMSKSSQFGIIDQVVEIERKLASVSFPMQGCLYYTSNLKSKIPDAKGLDTMLSKLPGLEEEDCRQMSYFAIGPSNDRKLWHGERHSMKLDRGPCKLKGYLKNVRY